MVELRRHANFVSPQDAEWARDVIGRVFHLPCIWILDTGEDGEAKTLRPLESTGPVPERNAR